MSTSAPLKQYKQNAKAAAGAELGYLLWYMVSETSIRWTDLKDALDKHNLSQFVPRKPRNEDVFLRVAQNGHAKRVSTTNDQIHVNYLIRQVKSGGGSTVKHIVIETVDADGETLDFEDVVSLRYDGTDLTYATIGAGDATAEELALKIINDFSAARGRVDAAAVRNIIRKVLAEARAVAVRPTGGVYFVMPAYVHLIENLELVAETLPGAFVHPLPLVDDRKQRDMLRRAYEAETVGEVDRSLEELSKILADKGNKITPAQYARQSAKFSTLLDKHRDYDGLLQDLSGTAESKLTILRQQMASLLRRVES